MSGSTQDQEQRSLNTISSSKVLIFFAVSQILSPAPVFVPVLDRCFP